VEIVINKQFGGFSISALAVKKLAELDGRDCYFFKNSCIGGDDNFEEITLEEAGKCFFWFAFSVKNPEDYFPKEKRGKDGFFTAYNNAWEKIGLDNRELDRSNKNLIKVIRELGKKANGPCASLKIVKIPDGVDFEIDEYDGMESIHEKHRSWG
jgi:hypothetical protein